TLPPTWATPTRSLKTIRGITHLRRMFLAGIGPSGASIKRSRLRISSYFRWLQTQTASVAPGSVGEQLSSTRSARLRSFVLADVQAFTPNVTNRLSISHTGLRVMQGESEGSFNPIQGSSAVTTIGLQGVNPNGYIVMGFPTVNIAGLTGLSMAYGGANNNLAQSDTTTVFEDSVTWVHGRHAIKAGAQATHYSWVLGAIPQNVYASF